ncbi:hypothetical protein V8G54_010758 [Vigna mungo]|uniref:Uncharacterized protein n=1 Tax=Vigna mungo TaxID=3915 RepID=A0AAQ3S6P2_VIGMU
MVKRVLSRNEGRVDDNIDKMRNRLKVFEALNLPVIDYYAKGKLYRKSVIACKSFVPVFDSATLSQHPYCVEILTSLPSFSNAASPTHWGALLNACFLHEDATIGEIVFGARQRG